MIKKCLAALVLGTSLLTGCVALDATESGYLVDREHQPAASALYAVISDTVAEMGKICSPARTQIALSYPADTDPFTSKFVSALRSAGFAVSEPETGKQAGGNFRYTLDSQPDGIRMTVHVNGMRLSRAYTMTGSSMSHWTVMRPQDGR